MFTHGQGAANVFHFLLHHLLGFSTQLADASSIESAATAQLFTPRRHFPQDHLFLERIIKTRQKKKKKSYLNSRLSHLILLFLYVPLVSIRINALQSHWLKLTLTCTSLRTTSLRNLPIESPSACLLGSD